LVIATGIVSAATLSVATVGFLQDFFSFSKALGIVLLVAAMCGLSIWGVKKAVWAVLIITFLEIAALLYIFFF
jgi:amino acid transporter